MNLDLLMFLGAWAANTLQVAASAPSGDALVKLITSEISAATGLVLELGPGTGVFTRALLACGIREENLALIEYGSEFAQLLQLRFARARVLWMDAAKLGSHDLYPDERAGAVVSGLPLLSMLKEKVKAMLGGAFAHLTLDGSFY